MRLIDAEIFDKELKEYSDAHCDGEFYAAEYIRCILEDAPTVNPYKWISVEDRLPEFYKSCIVCSEHGNIRIGYYNGRDKWFESRYNGDLLKYITHWTYLPIPPTEKEN